MASPGGHPPARNMLDFNPFRVLGVTASTTDEELRKAFHKKMKVTHPDKVGGKEDLDTKLNQAYDILKNLDRSKRMELERVYSGGAPEQSGSSVIGKKALSEAGKQMMSAHESANVVIQEPPIFPSLIWDMILGMLEDSKDVSSAVQAIPQLGPLVTKKAHKWRFGEVLPNLIPYLKLEDVLTCRLVCKKWSGGLDQYLGSNPDLVQHCCIPIGAKLKDYLTEEGTARQLWFYGVREFSTREMIDEFLQDMEGHPTSRNPFLGRKVLLEPGVGRHGILNVLDLARFWDGVHQLLDKFGEHVWDIKMNYPRIAENPASFSQVVLNCFKHLPNLKHFTFGFGHHDTMFTDNPNSRTFRNGAMAAVNEFIESRTLPPPKLESLRINFRDCPPPLISFLLSWFSPTLRKLTLKRHETPKRGLPKLLFPNLIDLSIEDSTPLKFLRGLLQNLDVPQVSSLDLSLKAPDTEYNLRVDLFPFLKKIPNLGSLILKCSGWGSCIVEEDYISAATLSMPSVKSLKISSNNPILAYNFLLCFPSLEELEIGCKYKPSPEEEELNWTPPDSTVKLTKYLRNGRLYKSNVGDLLPNLKDITVKSSGPSPWMTFTRETKVSYDNMCGGCRKTVFGY